MRLRKEIEGKAIFEKIWSIEEYFTLEKRGIQLRKVNIQRID